MFSSWCLRRHLVPAPSVTDDFARSGRTLKYDYPMSHVVMSADAGCRSAAGLSQSARFSYCMVVSTAHAESSGRRLYA